MIALLLLLLKVFVAAFMAFKLVFVAIAGAFCGAVARLRPRNSTEPEAQPQHPSQPIPAAQPGHIASIPPPAPSRRSLSLDDTTGGTR